jgi:general secretion pathway protein D
VQIAVDGRVNAIIVRGDQTTMAQVRALIASLDGMHSVVAKPVEDRPTKVFSLRFAEAAEVARILSTTLATGKVAVASDSRTNSLIVSGSNRDLDTVMSLVQNLDRAERQRGFNAFRQPDIRVFTLSHATAADVARVLNAMEKDRSEASVSSDDYSNTVIVRAAPPKMAEVENLIRKLDVKKG